MFIKEYRRVARKDKNLKKKSRVMSYAHVVNGSPYDKLGVREYVVARYKDRTYGCNCPNKIFRKRRRCRHILAFIKHEKRVA